MAEPDATQAAQPTSPNDPTAGAGPEARIIEAAEDEAPAPAPAAAAVAGALGANVVDLKRIHAIKVLVQAVLGGINMSVAKLSELKEGEVVPLDAKIGDPIDILTNGQLMARGEIVVIEGPEPRFGIQITSLEPQGGSNS